MVTDLDNACFAAAPKGCAATESILAKVRTPHPIGAAFPLTVENHGDDKAQTARLQSPDSCGVS